MERTLGMEKLKAVWRGRKTNTAAAKTCRVVAIASGKGGTGKSIITASLAYYFASHREKTGIFDADLGVGNAHILQGVSPAYTVAHVVSGLVELPDIGIESWTGVEVFPAGSGVAGMTNLGRTGLLRLARGFEKLERSLRWLFIDSAAGISEQTLRFAIPARRILLITTPDLTAMTDAYATIKLIHLHDKSARISLIVNHAQNESSARVVSEKIRGVAKRFLGKEVDDLGWIPEDRAIGDSIAQKAPILSIHPDSPAGKALSELAQKLEAEFAEGEAGNSYSSKFSSEIPAA